MKRDIKMERFLKHPPERVWQALIDPQQLAAWYMENDFQPVVGHSFQFRTDPGPNFDGIINCEVTEIDPPNRLVYTFRSGWKMQPTTVTWTLTPHNDGTLLRLDHTGFKGLSHVIVSGILHYGWWRFLRKLPPVLTQQSKSGEHIHV